MKCLTINTWHGLSGRGHLRFGELEPRARRERRRQALLNEIRTLSPDLICLQELNPVQKLAADWAGQLGYRQIHCRDNSGLKLGGFGLPLNLDSGLAILYPGDWKLISHQALRLSGPEWSVQNEELSFQLKESRWALMAHFRLPSEAEVLVVNAHLHHGAEMTPELFESAMAKGKARGATEPELDRLASQLRSGDERRGVELATLLRVLEKAPIVDGVILAGDLNSSPQSSAVHTLQESGFVDLWAQFHPQNPGKTWDRKRNEANHHLLKGFVAGFQLSERDEKFSDIESLVRAQEELPRRIDYVFWKSTGQIFQPRRISMVMTDVQGKFGLLPSDHFGLLAEFSERGDDV